MLNVLMLVSVFVHGGDRTLRDAAHEAAYDRTESVNSDLDDLVLFSLRQQTWNLLISDCVQGIKLSSWFAALDLGGQQRIQQVRDEINETKPALKMKQMDGDIKQQEAEVAEDWRPELSEWEKKVYKEIL